MSLKHHAPRNEYLLVLLLLSSSALLMAGSTPVAEEEVEQQQEEGAMDEKCLYEGGSITCTGNTTCCTTGQYNYYVPQCIDPSTEHCCLTANSDFNFSFTCPLNTQCCDDNCCVSCGSGLCVEGWCCTGATGNSVCCEEGTCAWNLDSPCLPSCGSNGACPEPMKCCNDEFCYDPSTAVCCNDQNDHPWACKSGQTCGSTQWNCCDQQACGDECYEANVSQCCYADEVPFTCAVTDVCCPYGTPGPYASYKCCPADTTCCAGWSSDDASCCYANQTCCSYNAGSEWACCNEGEVCAWDGCVPATHSPEKEGRKG